MNCDTTNYIVDSLNRLNDTLNKIERVMKHNSLEEKEANAYVRDKLLIQWLYENKNLLVWSFSLEDVYKKWMSEMGGKLD